MRIIGFVSRNNIRISILSRLETIRESENIYIKSALGDELFLT